MGQPTFPDYRASVPELLKAGRERFADRDCVVTPTERLSYRDLDERSRHLAARLLDAGVGKCSRVGVLFPNGARWVLAWAAVTRIGAVAIPVNTFYRTPELARFLRHSDLQYLLGVGAFIHHNYLERLEEIEPNLTNHGPGPMHLPGLPHLRKVLLWDAAERPWSEGGYGSGLEGDPPSDLARIVDATAEDVTPSDVMLVTYTSGTTGEPKGVVHSHGAMVRHAWNLAAYSGLDCDARLWTPMPLCWVGGFLFTLLRAMAVGGCFVTQEVFEAGSALRILERERVTHVSAWKAVTNAMREHPDFASTDLSSLVSTAFYDALPPERRPRDPGLVLSALGMTETCGPHTCWKGAEEAAGAPEAYRGAFGHPVPGIEHRIVDPESGTDLPPETEGEVLVRGYSLMLGLYKHERSDVFDADGWYHTGDRGYFRDGWFFFTGRQSDLIKTSGANVSPSEVEECLLEMEGVKLAFVVGLPHPTVGEEVAALVVAWREDASEPSEAKGLDPKHIKDGLRLRLSSYKVPRYIFVVANEDIPWLVSQKADRRALVRLAEKLRGAGQ